MKQMKSICVPMALITGIALAQPAERPKSVQPPTVQTAPVQPSTDRAPAADSAPAAAAASPTAPSSALSLASPGSAAEQMRAAIQRQRAAVRQQAQSAGAWLIPWSDEPGISWPPSCATIAEPIAAPLIESAANANQIQVPLLHALIEQESGFHPCAVSSKGAQGLTQLMPDTAGFLGVRDPFDPRQSIEAGARYLKQLLDKYRGNLKLALGAYNAGPAAVDAAGAIPDIPETRDYVDAILKKIK